MTQAHMEAYARHFVVTIDVKQVNKMRPTARSAQPGELGREIVDVARMTVSDSSLDGLIKKAKAHLDLVDLNGTNDIDTK